MKPKISILKQINKEVLRRNLGWDIDKITLLVVGSPRMKSLMDFIYALDETEHQIQFVLVAGGDDDQYQIFQKSALVHPAEVYNFVDNLPEMMRAADMIICKAGGLIVTESLASSLPLMLIHMIPGQEKGNLDYVIEHQAGAYCDTPQKLRMTLDEWLADRGKKLLEISKNAEKIGRLDAARQIAAEAWNSLN